MGETLLVVALLQLKLSWATVVDDLLDFWSSALAQSGGRLNAKRGERTGLSC